MKKRFLWITIGCIGILFCVCVSFKSHVNIENDTKQQIIGVWKDISGTLPYENIKIITKERFIWTWTSNNIIMFSASGTYTFDGETYIENIEYGTQSMRNEFGKKAVMKIRFEGNKMYYSGIHGDNVSINRIFERME